VLYKLYGEKEVPKDILPMSIHKFGNSSVATIPTLYDMVKHGSSAPTNGARRRDHVCISGGGDEY
jgi:3-oxoacyl-[acyl-carrier-protein] synthase-3